MSGRSPGRRKTCSPRTIGRARPTAASAPGRSSSIGLPSESRRRPLVALCPAHLEAKAGWQRMASPTPSAPRAHPERTVVRPLSSPAMGVWHPTASVRTTGSILVAASTVLLAACGSTISPAPGSPGGPASLSPPTSSGTASQVATAAPSASSAALPMAGTWTELSVAGEGPAPRDAHTWTVDPVGRVAYLFGGRDGSAVFGDLWRFDLATERWERLAPSGKTPPARFGHDAVWFSEGGFTGLV